MSDQTRVLLWAVPRTCSSILLKSLTSIPDSQMIYELYVTAYLFGPERVRAAPPHEPTYEGIELDEDGLLKGPGSGFKSSICTFDWVKRQLEADYHNKKVIIAKDLVPWLNRRYMYNHIPKGYRHIFLIRNPYKVFSSWEKLLQQLFKITHNKALPEDISVDHLMPEGILPGKFYRETLDLWLHVKENSLDADPIIIDSDDLLKNPKEILSAVCSRVGIPYSDSLLSWQAGTGAINQWTVSSANKSLLEIPELSQNTMTSTCFNKPVPDSQIPDLTTFSPFVQQCIEDNMPDYLKLFEQRLKC